MIPTSFLPRGKLKLENERSPGGVLLLTTYPTASKTRFGSWPQTQPEMVKRDWQWKAALGCSQGMQISSALLKCCSTQGLQISCLGCGARRRVGTNPAQGCQCAEQQALSDLPVLPRAEPLQCVYQSSHSQAPELWTPCITPALQAWAWPQPVPWLPGGVWRSLTLFSSVPLYGQSLTIHSGTTALVLLTCSEDRHKEIFPLLLEQKTSLL